MSASMLIRTPPCRSQIRQLMMSSGPRPLMRTPVFGAKRRFAADGVSLSSNQTISSSARRGSGMREHVSVGQHGSDSLAQQARGQLTHASCQRPIGGVVVSVKDSAVGQGHRAGAAVVASTQGVRRAGGCAIVVGHCSGTAR